TSHSVALSGLSASTTYHYRVRSRDAANNPAVSGNFTFATPAPPDTTPPVITGVASSNVTSSGATIAWATNEPSDTQVDYGTTTAYGASSPLNPTMVTSHSVVLSGLSASTTYHYRVRSRDAANNLAVSGNFTFTTPAASDTMPPVITGIGSSNVTSSGATIAWTTNEPADRQVEYGSTPAYGASSPLNSAMLTSHSVTLAGLSPSTTYHYRARSRDAAGNLAVSGNFAFTTPAAPGNGNGPAIDMILVAKVSSRSSTIMWITDRPSDSQVEYGPSTAYGFTTKRDPALVTTHTQNINKLPANTLFHFRVRSRDAAGNVAVSEDMTFQTTPSPRIRLRAFYPTLTSKSAGKAAAEGVEYTGIAVANLSDVEAILTFTAYDQDGQEISGDDIQNPVERVLGAGTQLPILDIELFGPGLAGKSRVGWVKVESTVTEISGFTLIFDESLNTLDGGIAPATPLEAFVFPEVQDQGFTDFRIANPNDSPARIDFHLTARDGSVRSTASRDVSGNGILAETAAGLFPDHEPSASDYVIAFATRGVVPFELLGRRGRFLKGLSGQDALSGATTVYSPQYATGGPWLSALSIINLNPIADNLTLRLIGDDGAQIGATRLVPIGPLGKVHIQDPNFFGAVGAEMVQGYVQISSVAARLVGSVTFGDPAGERFATSLPLISEMRTDMVFSQVASDDTYFTGIALLNRDAESALARIELYSADGSLVAARTEVIPAKRRISRLLTQYFPEIGNQKRSSGYVRVTADRGLAGFALFGTHNLTVLSAVPAQEVPY
ncbi:MAG: fibronectin type III domain-containing protein, partial [Acidobacteriota bacterium]